MILTQSDVARCLAAAHAASRQQSKALAVCPLAASGHVMFDSGNR
jgi:uncharacterized protein GlcG (DUF336 family)